MIDTIESEVVLEAKGIKKSFSTPHREKIHVIDDVDLILRAGESLSIRGESGAGKTTLLNLITMLEKPDKGEIFWEGIAVSKKKNSHLAEHRGSFFGLVFQSHYLIPELNAIENVLMARRLIGPVEAEDKKRARELLTEVGLKHRINHLSTELSGGEAQRVSIARALMNGPRVIVADEPTGNLDEKTGLEVMNLLLSFCEGVNTCLNPFALFLEIPFIPRSSVVIAPQLEESRPQDTLKVRQEVAAGKLGPPFDSLEKGRLVERNSHTLPGTRAIEVSGKREAARLRSPPVHAKSTLSPGPRVVIPRLGMKSRIAVEAFRIGAVVQRFLGHGSVANAGGDELFVSGATGHVPTVGLLRTARNNINDAVHGVRTPKTSAGAAHDLDSLDVIEKEILRFPINAGEERSVDASAID